MGYEAPNNYSFVYVTYLATFPNEDLSLKKGDYFQLKLDKGVRPDGVVDRNVAKGPSIYDYYSDLIEIGRASCRERV